MLANDRRRFTRLRTQAAIWTALAAESVWLSRRILRAGRYEDAPAMWADTLTSGAAMLVSSRGLSAGAAPWTKNVAIGAAIGASSAARSRDAVAAVSTLCVAGLLTGLGKRGRDAPVAGVALAFNDAVSWAGVSAASRVYLNAHRRYALLRDEADELAVERSAAVAAQAERGRQHEALHRVTIDALRAIARSTQMSAARAIARAEASRLRYALRAEGRLPQGLDEALADVADEMVEAGFQLELVTAELDADLAAAAVSAVRTALASALTAAREIGGARRAVVRARSEDGDVRISIRDHGAGFDPGLAGPYSERVEAITALLESIGGDLTVWSEPGEGVRLDLRIASSRSGGDEATDGVPDSRIRLRPAGDDDGAGIDNHVEVGPGRRLLGAQDDVGVIGARDDGAGISGEALQSRAQQGPRSADANGWSTRHLNSLAPRLVSRVGVSTQFRGLDPDDTRRADRTLLVAVLTWRATGLLTGAAAFLAAGSRHRRRSIAFAELAVAATESIWFAVRATRLDRWSDPFASTVDAATGTALLVSSQWNLAPAYRVTWLSWVPWSFAENVICGQAMTDRPLAARLAGAAVVASAHLQQGPSTGDRIANGAAHAAFFSVASAFAAVIRSGAVRLDAARAAAVREGELLAQAQERAVQLRLLHDNAVQTLEAVTSGRYTDLDGIVVRASREADELERELLRTRARAQTLNEMLQKLARDQRALGLQVEVDLPAPPALPFEAVNALCGACREALTNVAKHSGQARAVVKARVAGSRVVVEVRDNGVGFDPAASFGGFGTVHSIRQRMADAGGRAEIVSAPGQGTAVIVSWPA